MTDIPSIVTQMTLEEKAALCTGATAWTSTPVDRLGVPAMFVADGPHGITAQLVAGTSTIDEVSRPLRFVTLGTVLPGVVGAVIVLGITAFFLARWQRRRRRPAPAGVPCRRVSARR